MITVKLAKDEAIVEQGVRLERWRGGHARDNRQPACHCSRAAELVSLFGPSPSLGPAGAWDLKMGPVKRQPGPVFREHAPCP